jgi:hypothetical protein
VNIFSRSIAINTPQSHQRKYPAQRLPAPKPKNEWSLRSVEKLGNITSALSVNYAQAATTRTAYAAEIMNRPVQDVLSAETGFDIGRNISNMEKAIADEFSSTSNLLSKFSVFAKRSAIGIEVATKINDIRNAAPDQQVRVGIVKGAELLGTFAGAALGDAAVAFLFTPSLGTSLALTPAATVGTAAAGEYMFGHIAEQAISEYDNLTRRY